jgi:hypothetical protein
MAALRKLVLLNTSVLTEYGTYIYSPLHLSEVRSLVREYNEGEGAVESAVGHGATAAILSRLLELPVTVNRVEYKQAAGDVAIVFKLRARPPEGVVFAPDELEAIGFDFGLLTRVE